MAPPGRHVWPHVQHGFDRAMDYGGSLEPPNHLLWRGWPIGLGARRWALRCSPMPPSGLIVGLSWLRVCVCRVVTALLVLVGFSCHYVGSDRFEGWSAMGFWRRLALSSLAVLRVLQASYDADQREFVCLTALVVAALLYFLVITLGMVPLILACSIAPALAMCLLGDDEGLRFARVEGSIQSAAATPAWDWLRVLSSLALPLGLSFMQGILLASERGIERPGEWSSVIGAATLVWLRRF